MDREEVSKPHTVVMFVVVVIAAGLLTVLGCSLGRQPSRVADGLEEEVHDRVGMHEKRVSKQPPHSLLRLLIEDLCSVLERKLSWCARFQWFRQRIRPVEEDILRTEVRRALYAKS